MCKTVRSTSSQGLSAIQVVFDRGGDPYRQRQVVTERLAEFAGLLPQGVGAPLLSPLSSSMEYLVHFGYTSDRLSPVELRDVVQWIVKPQILAVPGVAQAQIFGGEVRERQIEIDPAKLAAAGLALDDVLATAKRATAADRRRLPRNAYATHRDPRAGSRRHGRRRWRRRWSARATDLPVRLGDIATMREGAEPRFGDALIAGKPGILIETSTQFGANTLEVTRALEQRLDALAPALAKQGVQYHPALLRPASFIESAIEKLRNSLCHRRRARGRAVADHPARLARRIGFLQRDPARPADDGVDSRGLGTEPQHHDARRSRRRARRGGRRCRHRRRKYSAPPPRRRRDVDIGDLFIGASLEVRRPVFYATAAVAVAFLPILMMSGLQGAFFRPLSISFLLAVGLSLLVAMSATPALCALAMARHQPKPEAAFLRHLKRRQLRAIAWLDARPRTLHRDRCRQRRCRNRVSAACWARACCPISAKIT